ncbi:MAG: hypothetical protein R3A45_07435 [Bdellovibrionota bacterium]
MDWEGAGWDGATAGLSSQQATQFFQGEASKTRSAREFFGSGAQTSLKSFTSSQGDEKALLDGFVNGLMSSDSFGSWVTQKENENGVLEDRKGLEGIIMGAAGGAITSTATGALQGEVDFKKVAKGAAMGGLQSKAMADVVTSNKYSGDPRGSFSFGALNGAASTLINGGNAKDAAFAAANGAFYSQQIQVGMQDKKLLRTISNVAFQSGMSLAQGNSLETVGNSALSGAMGYGREQVGGQINVWSQTQFTQSVENATSQGGLETHPDGITSNIIENDPSLQNYAASEQAAYEDAITDSIFMNTTHYDPFGGTG